VRQLLGTRQDRFAFGRALPAQRRAEIRNGAFALELSTSARRPEDGDICMSGGEEIARQLATPGTQAQEQPLRPGELTRTVDIRPGPTYRPRFLPPETWHGRQSQVRDLLPGVIERLLPAN
jgi:hypothetical protein